MRLLDKLRRRPEAATAPGANNGSRRKVMVIGLDCAPPEQVFDEYTDDMPNITKLRENSVWGPLESITPPITVPAWMCMMTSKDPGTLGIYGFRNRKDHTYEGLTFATSWPLKGVQIGCFLTPTNEADYTYPKELKAELLSEVGEYIFDVRNFRTDNTQYILDESYKMTEQRFKADNPYRESLRDYYRYLDGRIGDLLDKHADADTVVLVVSDHGAKAMVGG